MSDAEAATTRARRRLFTPLGALAAAAPGLGYSSADALAAITRPLPRGVAREEIADLLPGLTDAELDAAVRRSWSNAWRGETMMAAFRRGGLSVARSLLVRDDRLAVLEPPLVLATFHLGPVQLVEAALERLSAPVVIMRSTSWERTPRENVIVREIDSDIQKRSEAFHDSLACLRAGGFALAAPDAHGRNRIAVPMLRRRFSLARGAFGLARLAPAPLQPIFFRWREASVELAWGEQVPAAEDEGAMASALANEVEHYLIDNPGEISRGILNLMA